MRFWTREIIGWGLVLLGLLGFFVCYEWLADGHYIEAGILSFIAVIVFRGGIHLIKVAVAARICLHAQEQVAKDHAPVITVVSTGRAPSPVALAGPSRRLHR